MKPKKKANQNGRLFPAPTCTVCGKHTTTTCPGCGLTICDRCQPAHDCKSGY